MKVEVKVKDLFPNPYRNMKEYPVDREKIEALKNSIEQTEFWDNLVARKENGQIQIAYGHHRLIALQELEIEKIGITIRDLDDSTMLQIMANENMEQWSSSTSVVIETVKATRDFLNSELAKYDSWEEFRANRFISSLIDGERGYRSAKGQGVGQTTILKFLGKNWEKKQHLIQDALHTLDLIKDDIIDEKAIKQLEVKHLKEFTSNVEKNKTSKKDQVKYAKIIKEEEVKANKVKDIFVREKYETPKKNKLELDNRKIKFEDIIAETTNNADELSEKLKIIIKYKEDFDSVYYRQTIERLRLLMSIDSLKKQFVILTKQIKEYEEETVTGEDDTLRIGR
jgi:hypothetical protein